MSDNQEDVLIDAFQMMWGHYPEPVRLIDRSFRIVAGNAAYMDMNGAVDVKCNATNPELHKGCQAMAALKEKKTKMVARMRDDVEWVSYWIPVEGHDDYYIHFTNGLKAYMEKQASLSKV